MLRRLEDITVITAAEFLSYDGDMIFVDTDCPFQSQPLSQVFVAISDSAEDLPTMWQESTLFGGDIFSTFESGTLHTFISLELKEQLEESQALFIKVILLGEAPDLKAIRRD